jgi:predicted transcriptional regulator
MQVLWGSSKSMQSGEIAKALGLEQSYIINTLSRLEKKGFVATDEIVKVGKTFARTFKPIIGEGEYSINLMKYNRYQSSKDNSSKFVASFFSCVNDKEMLEEVQKYIKKKKEELK